MKAAERQRMIDRHRDSLARHGYSPRTLFWDSRGIQKIRFRVLAEIGVVSGDSLLDVGCGFADLHSWLAANDMAVDYTGLDLSPELIGEAERLHPDATLHCGELFDFDWPECSFDWVLLSGTLNWQLDDDGAYARRVIARMFALCRKGVAFNMLNNRHPEIKARKEFAAFDAEEMLAFCQSIAPASRCRTDYLDHDFTIYMPRG
jgi:SAM-dependent methyltransferase